MTHIEQMIQDLCPNGVEFKKLGEVADILNGYAFKSELYSSDGIRIIRISDVQKGSFSNKDVKYYPLELQNEFRSFILKEEDIAVSLTGNCGRVAYVTKEILPAALNQRVACLRIKEKVLSRYLFHVLNRSQFECEAMSNANGGGQKNLSTIWLAGYTIPLPPLEIQKKIVECLDKFSALAAELQAELQMRRKQYEYYRTQLLTPHSDCNSATKPDDCNWEWTRLGEICTILRGKRLTKSELSEDEKYPVFHGGIEPLGYYKEHNREADTVMIINVGASAGTVGYSDKEFWSSDGCYCLSKSESAIPKFMYYLLQKRESELKSRVRYAGIPTLDSDVIKKMQIALPPLAEQARIVSILDKFEALTTSLSDGIPAEQAAQQKRYEYYRDLLLTFEKRP